MTTPKKPKKPPAPVICIQCGRSTDDGHDHTGK